MSAVMKYHTNDGARTIIVCKMGRTKVHVVWIESSGVRAVALPREEARRFRAIENYPIRKAMRAMKLAGKTLGISARAKKLLSEVAA